MPGLLTGDGARFRGTCGEEEEEEEEELRPWDRGEIRSTASRTTRGDIDISADILDMFFGLKITVPNLLYPKGMGTARDKALVLNFVLS